MGNQLGGQGGFFKNPFSQPEISSEFQDVRSEFSLKTRYDDPYFGSVCLLEHKSTLELIILKEVVFDSMQAMEANYLEFQKRKQKLTCENLVRLRYIMKKTERGFLSDEYKIILFFDYILIDLQTQVENRRKQRKTFSSQEVGNILAATVKGYAFLEKQEIPNNKIRFSNIYFGVDGHPVVKVSDPNLFPSIPNTQTVLKKEKGYEQIFLAPEELRALDERTITFSKKSGVFTLGICLLELCLLQPSQQLYNYREKTINLREMDQRLNMIKNKYPLGVYYVLKEMLEKSEEHRLSFSDLEQKMPTNIKNYSAEHFALTVAYRGATEARTNVVPLIPKPKGNSTATNPSISESSTFSKTKIVPAIVPAEVRQTTTLTSQYRPQVSMHLQEVNEIYTNGNSYKGQKNAQNQRHGKGKYIYADGSYYYGDWVKNKMSGNGILYYSDGQVEYDGEWKEDMFDGRGTLYGRGCDWNKYEGEFQNGEMCGFGTMSFNDGNVFTGSFRSDKPVGKGRMSFRDGSSTNGVWQAGNFVKQ